jgi:hypothetical protein
MSYMKELYYDLKEAGIDVERVNLADVTAHQEAYEAATGQELGIVEACKFLYGAVKTCLCGHTLQTENGCLVCTFCMNWFDLNGEQLT